MGVGQVNASNFSAPARPFLLSCFKLTVQFIQTYQSNPRSSSFFFKINFTHTPKDEHLPSPHLLIYKLYILKLKFIGKVIVI